MSEPESSSYGELEDKYLASPISSECWRDSAKAPEKVETICCNCVFATFTHPADRLLQTGCLANMLKKYQEQGVELKEYVDENEQKFFGIPDRVCLFHRTQSWLDRQPQGEDLVLIARDEITLRLEVIIYIEEGNTFQDIGITVDSLAHGKIKPTKVVFCDNQNIKPSAFRKWVTGRVRMGWRAEHIREVANFDRCIDIASKKITTPFFAVFRSGFKVPKDFISLMDRALNDDMIRFLLLQPCDVLGNGMVVSRLLNQQIGHGQEKSLIEKIEYLVRSQQCQYLIKDATEIVPSLKKAINCPQSLSSSLVAIMENL